MRDLAGERRSALEDLQAGNLEEAERKFLGILRVQPENVSVLHFLGLVYYQRKEYDASIQCIGRALELGPDYVDAYNNLGIVLQESGRMDEAIANYQKAIELNPGFERAYCNLGAALRQQWRLEEAIPCLREAIRLNPVPAEPYHWLANALQDQGMLEQAEEYYREAIRRNPLFTYYDNFLMMLNYRSINTPETVFSEHLKYAEMFETPLLSALVPLRNDRSPVRRLRIGYVSPDFRRHSVKYFIEPVLASHSRNGFDVFCYSDVQSPDPVTERLQGYADHWRTIAGLTDEAAAEMIRDDGIDILVDLAGHTANNRLLMFCRRPAPVQVTWLGYPNTTGLQSIDYRIVDARSDPPGLTDLFCSEELVRMPESFLCYGPDEGSPAVGTLPALQSGQITFGSFNYYAKVSPSLAGLWAEILNAVPGSRLIMKARNFADAATRRYATELFAGRGIAPDRIEPMPAKESYEAHLGTYSRVDVALDTFPYHGTTTTCEALWMGVPVVVLAGSTHASRVGMSLLANVGLPEFVAQTGREYVSIAAGLAGDLERLALLRKDLRGRMGRSPLCNATVFCRALEDCYREMWERWCESGTPRTQRVINGYQ